MDAAQNTGGVPVTNIGWSFADLPNMDKISRRKVVEPLSALIIAAILPFYASPGKICLADRKISVAPTADYTINVRGITLDPKWLIRRICGDNINNLEVFKLNAVKAAELHDPVTNVHISLLFDYAYKGIPFAKDAYQGQSTPQDAIDKYQTTILDAKNGVYTFNEKLSAAEEKVKAIWSVEEINSVNTALAAIVKNGRNYLLNEDHMNYIISSVNKKQELFKSIYQQVKEKTISIEKGPKRIQPAQGGNGAPPPQLKSEAPPPKQDEPQAAPPPNVADNAQKAEAPPPNVENNGAAEVAKTIPEQEKKQSTNG